MSQHPLWEDGAGLSLTTNLKIEQKVSRRNKRIEHITKKTVLAATNHTPHALVGVGYCHFEDRKPNTVEFPAQNTSERFD